MIRPILFLCGVAALVAANAAVAQERGLASVLVAGERAEAAKNAPGLLDAAQALERMGAHPADGTADLAAQWRAEAMAMGAHPTTAPWRGRTLGPAYRRGRVGAHATFTTRQSFNAGQRAEISVATLSGGPLDLNVRDDDDRDTCRVRVSEREGSCSWIPVWTGAYSLSLDNNGDDAAVFYIVTN